MYRTKSRNAATDHNVDSARCEIPTPASLKPDKWLVQWENTVYSSHEPDRPGVQLMADDGFLYTGGWFHGAVRIHRVRLPNSDGLPNWDGFLTTPTSSDYIREAAEFVMAFETSKAVYFLLREPVPPSCILRHLNRQSHQEPSKSGGTEGRNSRNQQTTYRMMTRLVRVCKGDRGGYPYVNDGEFGTFAKANVECATGERPPYSNIDENYSDQSIEEFYFERAVAAEWDPVEGRLVVIFSTNSRHVEASAVCVYSESDLDASFDSALLSVAMDGHFSEKHNPFPDTCGCDFCSVTEQEEVHFP
ncbi:unnamed protein product [Dicrocoelium dendriticum]|nr:unnamed protein product [Dicrocoelium dendriticum]CAH8531512.1 unnamed protein product [Dicrocoelium dendriticum]